MAAWQLELHLAGGQLVHVQQVADQKFEPEAVLLRDIQHWAHGLRRLAQGTAGDQAEGTGDRGQRSAQFVADDRDEIALHALDALALGDIAQQADELALAAMADLLDAQLDGEDFTVAPDRR